VGKGSANISRPICELIGINPKRVQANGNAEAAQWLMALHHEWADVLHRYETHGIAMKAGRHSALKELLRMCPSLSRR